MTVQGIFLMGAFWASVEVGQSRLKPKPEDQVSYVSRPGGMRIEARYALFLGMMFSGDLHASRV